MEASTESKRKRGKPAIAEGDGGNGLRAPMDVAEAIRRRRSNKRWRDEPVPRAVIDEMLATAVLAPNHKMTEPWGFVILGDKAKRRYGKVRAKRKVGGRTDDKAAAKRLKIVDEMVSVPLLMAVTCREKGDRTRREEDYAATWMAIQNLLIVGAAHGVAAKIDTGGAIDDRKLRKLARVPDDHRIVTLLFMGFPEKERKGKRRASAEDKTTWLD